LTTEDLAVISHSLQDLMQNNEPFGGISIMLVGDFSQIN